MAAEDSKTTFSTDNRRRRSSFVEMFTARSPTDNPTLSSTGPKSAGPAMASAMAQQAQQSRTRRVSITSLGLSGSPTHAQQTSPFGTVRERSGSLADSGRMPSEFDESAIDEDGDAIGTKSANVPSSPAVPRRVSFGAKTSRENRSSSGASSTTPSTTEFPTAGSSKAATKKGPPSPSARKDGFNWSENLRNRAERTSISTATGLSGNGFLPLTNAHNRSKSVVTSDNVSTLPVQTSPATKPPAKPMPDHFQERILKGDFYMD